MRQQERLLTSFNIKAISHISLKQVRRWRLIIGLHAAAALARRWFSGVSITQKTKEVHNDFERGGNIEVKKMVTNYQ